MHLLTDPNAPEHHGRLAVAYLIDGYRLATTPAERREWLLAQRQAARDPSTLEAMREAERALIADGDQRQAWLQACESVRAALVRQAVRHAIRAKP